MNELYPCTNFARIVRPKIITTTDFGVAASFVREVTKDCEFL